MTSFIQRTKLPESEDLSVGKPIFTDSQGFNFFSFFHLDPIFDLSPGHFYFFSHFYDRFYFENPIFIHFGRFRFCGFLVILEIFRF